MEKENCIIIQFRNKTELRKACQGRKIYVYMDNTVQIVRITMEEVLKLPRQNECDKPLKAEMYESYIIVYYPY